MSRADYDKEALSSWRSFEEYSLFLDGYVRSIKQKTIDEAGETFHVIVADVFPTQKDKTPEGNRCYKLWFILGKRGSAYSAFCRCKGVQTKDAGISVQLCFHLRIFFLGIV